MISVESGNDRFFYFLCWEHQRTMGNIKYMEIISYEILIQLLCLTAFAISIIIIIVLSSGGDKNLLSVHSFVISSGDRGSDNKW